MAVINIPAEGRGGNPFVVMVNGVRTVLARGRTEDCTNEVKAEAERALGVDLTNGEVQPVGIPIKDLSEEVKEVLRGAVGSKPTYTIQVDASNSNAVTGPSWSRVESGFDANLRIEIVSNGETTWSSQGFYKYAAVSGNAFVIVGWRDTTGMAIDSSIDGVTRTFHSVSVTRAGTYTYIGTNTKSISIEEATT